MEARENTAKLKIRRAAAGTWVVDCGQRGKVLTKDFPDAALVAYLISDIGWEPSEAAEFVVNLLAK